MTSLVKRLQEVGGMSDDGATRWYINPDGPEAADRIEQLERALEKIAVHHRYNEEMASIARKALEGKDD